MSWYNVGTVTVTNGSTVVTGVGTDFVNNVMARDAFALIGGYPNEIQSVDSKTQLTLARPWLGAGAAGQAYVIQPTVGIYVDLALRALNMLTPFQAVLDGIGQGLIAGGTLAAPGLRFSVDQDTGIARTGENLGALVAGGVPALSWNNGNVGMGSAPIGSIRLAVVAADQTAARIALWNTAVGGRSYHLVAGVAGQLQAGLSIFDASTGLTRVVLDDGNGNVGIGTTTPTAFGAGTANFHVKASAAAIQTIDSGNCVGQFSANNNFGMIVGTTSSSPLIFYANNADRGRFDTSGNLLVGVTSGAEHRIAKAVSSNSGAPILQVAVAGGAFVGSFYGVSGGQGSAANAGFKVANDASTGRSINAGGTINANGADYAEYMRKAPGCGTILKGDICGVNAEGQLVRTWAEAVSFMVKSTDPNLVGGDSWDSHLPPKPEEPILVLPPYGGPDRPEGGAAPVPPEPLASAPGKPVRSDDEDDEAFVLRMARYLVDASAWANAIEGMPAAQAAYEQAIAAAARYAAELPVYEAAIAAYQVLVDEAEQDHAAALEQHAVDLAAWEVLHEEARSWVDRIAYCGQVPVNVDGDCAAGDYIVAAANGGGIKGVAVHPDDMTLPQYMRRVGKVLSIGADGRPIIDVQHG